MKNNFSSNFFKKVKSRHSQPKQPTNDGFFIRDWQDEYWSLNSRNEKEHRLFQSGSWFGERFEELKKKFNNMPTPYCQGNKDRLIRFQIGAVNYLADREFLKFHEINQKNLESSDVFEINNSLESIIESAQSSLIKLHNIKVIKDCTLTIDKWLNDSLNLSILYEELKYFWMQCLWHEWYVDTTSKDNIDIIVPNDFNKGDAHRVSLTWRDEIDGARLIKAFTDWDNMNKAEKDRLLKLPIVEVEYIDSNGNIKLGVSDRYKIQNRFPFEKILGAITLNNICYQELLKEPCPDFENLSLFQILLYWQFISPLAEQINNKLSSKTNILKLDDLLQYSPLISKKDLIKLTINVFNITEKQAYRIVDVFTFESKYEDDLWCQPLVRINEDSFTVVIKSLQYPNLVRCLDSWLDRSGWKKGTLRRKLGKLNESFIRKKLKDSNKLSNLIIYDYSIDFGKKQRSQQENDLVISLGNKIIIGELKRSKYPTEPIDFGYYYESLEKAGEQLANKIQFIKSNLENVLCQLQLTHLDPQQVELVPVIISNLPLATGQKINDFPIVDISILEMYMSDSVIELKEISSNEQKRLEKKKNKGIVFYTSEQEAEENIKEYLQSPPQLYAISKDTIWKYIPLPNLIAQSKPIFCCKPTVNNLYSNSALVSKQCSK